MLLLQRSLIWPFILSPSQSTTVLMHRPHHSNHTLILKLFDASLPIRAVDLEGQDNVIRSPPCSQGPAPRPSHSRYSRNSWGTFQALTLAPLPPGHRPRPREHRVQPLAELTQRRFGHLSLGRVPQFLGLGRLRLPRPLHRSLARLGLAWRVPGGCRGREEPTRFGGRSGFPSHRG